MAAAPPAAAAGDLLYCLGLGLALGAVRDVCGSDGKRKTRETSLCIKGA